MKKAFSNIRSNKGSMLILTLITITVIIILGVSALNVATTEAIISSNEVNRQKAIDAAEAGIAQATADNTNPDGETTIPTYTFGDGTEYSATKRSTSDTFEYYINSTGVSNKVTKNIKTYFTYINNLNKVNSAIIADKVTLQQSGASQGTISNGSVVANSQLNISGNVKLDVGATLKLGFGGSSNVLTIPMNVKYPVPQIDVNYYRQQANEINPSGVYNLNNNKAKYTNVNGYDLYFFDGNDDVTIDDNLANNQPAIIIATGNIIVNKQIGSKDKPVIIYSEKNVTINGDTNNSKNIDIQGVVIAKESINFGSLTNVDGALIAPTVSCSGSEWKVNCNTDIFKEAVITSVKLTQNKKVFTWNEN